jgi:hypothetical protein
MVQRVPGEEGMTFRLLSTGFVVGAGMLLASTFSAMAGEVTGNVDDVDMENHTISVNGEKIKVPEGMNVEGIVEGDQYTITYTGEGADKTLTQFEAKRM